jgi:hypothetical protein
MHDLVERMEFLLAALPRASDVTATGSTRRTTSTQSKPKVLQNQTSRAVAS